MFGVAVGLIIVYLILDGINGGIQSSPQFGAHEKGILQDFTTDFPTVWDFTFLTAFIAGIIGLMILTYYLDSNPGLFIAIILVVMILSAFAGYVANAWIGLGTGSLGAAISQFPIMNHVMSNYLMYILVTGFLMSLVFFAKPGGYQ